MAGGCIQKHTGQPIWFLLVTNKYFEKIAQVLFDSDEAFLHVGAQQERVHQSGFDQLLMVSRSDTVRTFSRKPPQSSLSNHIRNDEKKCIQECY